MCSLADLKRSTAASKAWMPKLRPQCRCQAPQPRGYRLNAASGEADHKHPRLPVDRPQSLVERVAADRVVDDISALAVGQSADAVADAFGPVIDQLVGAPRPRYLEFFGAARRGDDPRADGLADLGSVLLS